MTIRLALVLAATLLALAALPAQAETSRAYRYLAGAALPEVVVANQQPVQGGGFCTMATQPFPGSDGSPVYLGGVCHVAVEPGLVTIEVAPELGAALFRVQAQGASTPVAGDLVSASETCASEDANGSVTLDLPEGCTSVSVYLAASAVSGTVLIAQP